MSKVATGSVPIYNRDGDVIGYEKVAYQDEGPRVFTTVEGSYSGIGSKVGSHWSDLNGGLLHPGRRGKERGQ